MLWLDHKIFGDGHGLESPYFDNRFYWLVDTEGADRAHRRGTLYTFSHGLGAQLRSAQWTHPRPGVYRRLIGRRFRPFSSQRHGLRVEVSWAMVDLPRDIDAANAAIRELEADLNSTLMERRPAARAALENSSNG